MNQINKADLDFLDVTLRLWVAPNNFFKDFSSNTITKSNALIRHLLSTLTLISWENCASKVNHTNTILENILEIVQSYPVLRYMFWVYLEPD